MSNVEMLEALLKAYVDLNRLCAEPGEKSHKLWHSSQFIERQIREIIKIELIARSYE